MKSQNEIADSSNPAICILTEQYQTVLFQMNNFYDTWMQAASYMQTDAYRKLISKMILYDCYTNSVAFSHNF